MKKRRAFVYMSSMDSRKSLSGSAPRISSPSALMNRTRGMEKSPQSSRMNSSRELPAGSNANPAGLEGGTPPARARQRVYLHLRPGGESGAKVTAVVLDDGTQLDRSDSATTVLLATNGCVASSVAGIADGEDAIIRDYLLELTDGGTKPLEYPVTQNRILYANDRSPEGGSRRRSHRVRYAGLYEQLLRFRDYEDRLVRIFVHRPDGGLHGRARHDRQPLHRCEVRRVVLRRGPLQARGQHHPRGNGRDNPALAG